MTLIAILFGLSVFFNILLMLNNACLSDDVDKHEQEIDFLSMRLKEAYDSE